MINPRIVLAPALLLLFAGRSAVAAVLASSNFAMTSENYNTAGATAAASASFQTFIDAGDTIGVPSETALTAWSGFTYTLFGPGAASCATLLPPSALSAASLSSGRVALSWTQSPSADAVGYYVYYDSGSGTVDYTTPLAVVSTTSYTTAVLTSSVTYRFGLRAYNRCGFLEQNTTVVAAAGSTTTLSGVAAQISEPESGSSIYGNRVTVKAALLRGTPARVAQILFQYKASSSSVWITITPADNGHANPVTTLPYFVHWDVTGLTPSTYDLRVVATDISGKSDNLPAAVTVSVDPVNFGQDESLSGGQIVKTQTINNGAPATIQTGDSAFAQIVIPAGAVIAATTTVSVIPNPAGMPAASSGLSGIGAGVQVTLDSGQSTLSGGLSAPVTLSYADANDDGIVDGTDLRADQLQIYAYNTAAGRWQKDFSSTVDKTNHTVTGDTPHFSTFGLFVAMAADLSTVRVFPIPYRPNGGNPDQGVTYSAGNANSGIIFDNLPVSVEIKVYTISGQLVTSFGSDATSGRLQWSVQNDHGRDVASGLYIAVISSPGQATVTKKILIIR